MRSVSFFISVFFWNTKSLFKIRLNYDDDKPLPRRIQRPLDSDSFGTNKYRILDVENKRKQKGVIVIKSKERGARTKVTTCNCSPDGNLVGGGALLCVCFFFLITQWITDSLVCLDRALHMWQTTSNFMRCNMTIENTHTKGTETGSLVFSVDKQTVLTRGGDDTVKCECLMDILSHLHWRIEEFYSMGYLWQDLGEVGELEQELRNMLYRI